MGDTDNKGIGVIGLLVDPALPVRGVQDRRPSYSSFPPDKQREARILDLFARGDDEVIHRYETEICRLPAKGFGAVEFALAGHDYQLLLSAARDAMHQHLKARM